MSWALAEDSNDELHLGLQHLFCYLECLEQVNILHFKKNKIDDIF